MPRSNGVDCVERTPLCALFWLALAVLLRFHRFKALQVCEQVVLNTRELCVKFLEVVWWPAVEIEASPSKEVVMHTHYAQNVVTKGSMNYRQVDP